VYEYLLRTRAPHHIAEKKKLVVCWSLYGIVYGMITHEHTLSHDGSSQMAMALAHE
jgi:hypothetical protein